MLEVVLDTCIFKGKRIVLLRFPYDSKLISLVQQLPGIAWSNTLNAWHTAYSIELLHRIKSIFENKAVLNASALREKIAALKNGPAGIKEIALTEEAMKKVVKFSDWMKSRRYSESTIGTYTDALKVFLKYFHHKQINEITNDDVIEFNNKYILANHYSASYQNQVVNGVKLFFGKIENRRLDIEDIHRPKREKTLPHVLSKEEVKKILTAQSNIKHSAMLSLIYGCGLRCGELLSLKPEHIDSMRNVLIISQAKGKKDRIAPLSIKIIEMLRQYYKLFKPEVYLFEGQKRGEPYDERSLQQVLKQAVAKAKIRKPVTLHWLRHSYATHLLEAGTDIRYIQEILGHSSSRTTEIYTHVSTKSIQKIVSPFDTL
jgi:integrase/recombinase XerD